MNLIALHGLAGSGKDTVADYLTKYYGYTKISFAKPLKEIICILTGWSYPFVNGDIDREKRETLIHPDYGMTCRQLMQFIGTDLFRNKLHQDIWLKITKRYLEEHRGQKIVVTDCRFTNEINMMKNFNATIILIKRPSLLTTLDSSKPPHESEKNLIINNALVLVNNGNLNDLYQKIDHLFT